MALSVAVSRFVVPMRDSRRVSFHQGVPGDRSEDGYAIAPWPVPAPDLDTPPPDDPELSGLLTLAAVAAVGGVVTGVVGGTFRWLLAELTVYRDDLLVWARDAGPVRWVLPLALGAVAAALARSVVRVVPEASGSGVQRVEAHIRGEQPPAPPRVLPAKFVGGLLSMGVAGLVLGREGPTVQMGASIGAFFATRRRLGERVSGSPSTPRSAVRCSCSRKWLTRFVPGWSSLPSSGPPVPWPCRGSSSEKGLCYLWAT